MNIIDVLIYSKDRTAQLDLLIRSLKKNFENLGNIFVLYDFSSAYFYQGFIKIEQQHPDVKFVSQSRETFQFVIKDLVSYGIMSEFILPLCDDDFMPRKTNLDEVIKYFGDDVCGINLRYHPGMHINYLTEQHYDNPEFEPCDFPKWKWADPRWAGTSWSYPYQAGCELYRTSQFAHMLNNSTFVLPNTMEGAICSQATRWGKEYLMCMQKQHIINISINKVQTENGNRGGWTNNRSTTELNELLLAGREIDLEYCEQYCQCNDECDFIEMPLEFRDKV